MPVMRMARARRRTGDLDALVLAVLVSAGAPLSAHQIAARASSQGTPLVPMQSYRTLARLARNGRAQRVETMDAYLPRDGRQEILLICGRCRGVTRADGEDAAAKLTALVSDNGFRVSSLAIEVSGLCRTCGAFA